MEQVRELIVLCSQFYVIFRLCRDNEITGCQTGMFVLLEEGLAKYCPIGQTWPMACFIALLEYSYTHLFTYCLWLLSPSKSRTE